MNKGMSLLEILVTVTIFAVLGIIITRSIILTLQGSRKSESLVKVRENLDYAMGVVERQLRNADSIADCTNSDTTKITYVSQDGIQSSFSCGSFIASGSAQLTSSTVTITNCSFTCQTGSSANPSSVSVFFEGKDANATGVQNSTVSLTNQIFLRNY